MKGGRGDGVSGSAARGNESVSKGKEKGNGKGKGKAATIGGIGRGRGGKRGRRASLSGVHLRALSGRSPVAAKQKMHVLEQLLNGVAAFDAEGGGRKGVFGQQYSFWGTLMHLLWTQAARTGNRLRLCCKNKTLYIDDERLLGGAENVNIRDAKRIYTSYLRRLLYQNGGRRLNGIIGIDADPAHAAIFNEPSALGGRPYIIGYILYIVG